MFNALSVYYSTVRVCDFLVQFRASLQKAMLHCPEVVDDVKAKQDQQGVEVVTVLFLEHRDHLPHLCIAQLCASEPRHRVGVQRKAEHQRDTSHGEHRETDAVHEEEGARRVQWARQAVVGCQQIHSSQELLAQEIREAVPCDRWIDDEQPDQ
eukprot:249114-Rhodomonas_salina.2